MISKIINVIDSVLASIGYGIVIGLAFGIGAAWVAFFYWLAGGHLKI